MNMSVSGIIGILVIISLIAGLAGWAVYAYRNPHSASGQMLIRVSYLFKIPQIRDKLPQSEKLYKKRFVLENLYIN